MSGNAKREELSTNADTKGSLLLDYSANVNSGKTEDYEAALGLKIPVFKNEDQYKIANKIPFRSFVSPKIGYAFSSQEFERRGGVVNHSSLSSYDEGVTTKFDQDFDSQWKGAFMGVSVDNYFGNNHQVTLDLEAHFVQQVIKRNLMNNTTFAHPISFRDDGKGVGYDVGIKYRYQILENLALKLGFKYKNYSINNATHKEYYASGSESSAIKASSNWYSYIVSTGLVLSF